MRTRTAIFDALGAKIVSIMPDRQQFVGRLPADIRRRLTILSDIDNEFVLSLDLARVVARRIEPDFRERMSIEEIGLALQSLRAKQSAGRDARDGR